MTRILFVLIGILICPLAQGQEVQVESVFPISQSLGNEIDESIKIHFDKAMDQSSLNDSTLRIFGRWSGPMMGDITWTDGDSTLVFDPDEGFMNGEWVMVSLSREIQSDGGDSLNVGYAWNFWTKAGPGSLYQTEIAQIEVRYEGEGQITCYGAYAGDINNDGYSDMAVVNETSNDVRLFLNDGEGNYDDFSDHDLPQGNVPSPSEGGDFNNDGEIDMAIANTQNEMVSILMGDGLGSFEEEMAFEADEKVRGIGILDADGDGDDDIVTANRQGNNLSLLINDGSGNFEAPIHFESGGNTETGLMVIDLNNDGKMDLVVSAYNSQEVITMLGDGSGNFIIQDQEDVNGVPWMIAAGDLDNDGNADVASANSTGNNVTILFGDGNGNLGPAIAYDSPGFPLAMDLGDLDGDGDLDMISSNYVSIVYHVYENDGQGNFLDPITYPASGAASCTIIHDRDNDGDMDISGIDELDDLIFIYENDSLQTEILSLNPIAKRIISYPNPAQNSLSFIFPKHTEKSKLQVYTSTGILWFSTEIDTEIEYYEVNTGLWPEGVYFYEWLLENKREQSDRIVVVH